MPTELPPRASPPLRWTAPARARILWLRLRLWAVRRAMSFFVPAAILVMVAWALLIGYALGE
jgi:hypothetical protein